MKGFLSVLIIFSGLVVGWMNWDKVSGLLAKVPSPSPETSAATDSSPVAAVPSRATPNPAQEAQAQAMALYPGLRNSNSALNQKFVALYKQAQASDSALLSRPDWPITLAERAAVALGGGPMPRNAAAARPRTNKQVVIYTTSECPYCKLAKQYLTKKGVPFREVNIEMSLTGKDEYKRLGGNGVPLIMVGDQKLSGFSENALDRMLL